METDYLGKIGYIITKIKVKLFYNTNLTLVTILIQ